MQNKLYNMLMQRDEITWQTLIYELVRTKQMDPWDIDISLLVQRYLEALKDLKEANFFISGKVILAAAILLKIKSDKLLTENIANLDSQLFSTGEIEDLSDFEDNIDRIKLLENPKLTIKTPLARKKRVTLQDLMFALQKALDVDKRRVMRKIRESEALAKVQVPEKKIDITELIKQMYQRIVDFFKKEERLTFMQIVGSDRKEDKIMAFIPLLHLDNDGRIDLNQDEHFGEINVRLRK